MIAKKLKINYIRLVVLLCSWTLQFYKAAEHSFKFICNPINSIKFMPKLKTSSSISKRFKVTASSKLLRRKAGRSHLLAKKSPKRKNNLSQVICTNACDKNRFVLKIRL